MVKFGLSLVAVLILLFLFVYGLGQSLIPLTISFGLAYLLFPLVQGIEKWGVSRVTALTSVMLALFLCMGIALILLIPKLLDEGQRFVTEFPEISIKATAQIESFMGENGIPFEIDKDFLLNLVRDYATSISTDTLSSLALTLRGLFQGFWGWILGLLNLLLIPIFFFYVICDYERILKSFKDLIPRQVLPKANFYSQVIDEKLSGYIRGQLVVALILAVIFSLGLSFAGLKYGWIVGVLTGLLSFIPYVGALFGGLSSLVILLAYDSPINVWLSVALIFILAQTLESFFITPRLVGDKVGLNSLESTLALIIGGNLLGFIGILLAIPVAGILKVVLIDLKNQYFTSSFYLK